MFLRFLV